MANLIRLKQLDQPDLSGFFNSAFINTGILDATFVDKFTDENISGVKTFIDGVNLNNIDNLSLSGVDISIISGSITLTNRPTVNGIGVLLSGETSNQNIIVNTTGNQNISGTKNFYTRPTVNGTGVLLSGEILTLPATIVYTTGNQTISGNKTFINNINVSGSGTFNAININNISTLNLSGVDIDIKSGNVNLEKIPTVNGTGVLLSGSIPIPIYFGHKRNSTAAGAQYYYFGPEMDIDPVGLINNDKRRFQMIKKCFLRELTWTSIASTTAPIPSNAMTGYFKNFGNNPLTIDNSPGVRVTSAINIPTANILYNTSSGNLNIAIASGDYVCFYYETNHSTNAVNLATHVIAYFYV
jgi:hypothetical protein